MPKNSVNLIISATLMLFSAGCSSRTVENETTAAPPPPHEDLDATLWMQTAAEYQAATRQAYSLARGKLIEGLKNTKWSAQLKQQNDLAMPNSESKLLPLAVILDLDETVLDNSPYQARLIETNEEFDLESWHEWVEKAQATAIHGAKDFIDFARQNGVTVFYITNRDHRVEPATRKNLESLGLISEDALDNILTKNERHRWTSDKTSRREFVARRYRVVLVIGDDLNDFAYAGHKPTAEARRRLAQEHQRMWGDKWIILPNANYGAWERALYQWNDQSPRSEKIENKYKYLNSADGESSK